MGRLKEILRRIGEAFDDSSLTILHLRGKGKTPPKDLIRFLEKGIPPPNYQIKETPPEKK